MPKNSDLKSRSPASILKKQQQNGAEKCSESAVIHRDYPRPRKSKVPGLDLNRDRSIPSFLVKTYSQYKEQGRQVNASETRLTRGERRVKE
ncbi:hypothetical protein HYFRA_00010977 [Hymenoscyphus fraxineus]|uniref:Uncharacterized protein n=1 Tax=Hymenoscyphus fraxineus TaxID=746836 RepID=A0A9N9KZ47_9HELO|nr:hypothetical protein HYFRA_00010977 [Hymenoscyphus fraxineus]